MNTKKKIKKYISHHLGLRPFLENISDEEKKKFIPNGYQAVITISADFELAWAWQHAKNTDLKIAKKQAQIARDNIPLILDLCDKYNFPITWFTIGHLLLDSCKKENGIKHPEIKRLPYFENKYWQYQKGDWFEHDPCGNYIDNPEWYAPDIIQKILNRKAKHEIGCHTFSHIDCRDEICDSEVFNSEIEACKHNAKKFDLELDSFVHPAHTIGHIKELSKHGFTSFRDNSKQILGYPEKINNLWKLKSSVILNYTNENEKFQIERLNKIIKRTIKHNTNTNIWFHPSANPKTFDVLLKNLFSILEKDRNNILITTVGKYSKILENLKNE